MPDEDLETAELKEQIDQRLEDHEHHGHGKLAQPPGWLRYLSLSTAMIAVFAAVASLESGANSNEAILEKSEAMLGQSRASDAWSYFQAKEIKATVSENVHDLWVSLGAQGSKVTSSDGVAAAGARAGEGKPGDVAAKLDKLEGDAKRQRSDAEKIKKDAEELEAKVKESNRRCDELMDHHHRFAISVTLLQIAIALSAIAALTRRRGLWFLGMAVSAVGLAMFVRGFL